MNELLLLYPDGTHDTVYESPLNINKIKKHLTDSQSIYPFMGITDNYIFYYDINSYKITVKKIGEGIE